MIAVRDVKQLVERVDGPLLSVYLRTDPSLQENQSQTPAWRIWLKNSLRRIETILGQDNMAAWRLASQRITEYIEDNIIRARGLVIFAGEDMLEAIQLPVRPDDNEIAFGEPLVAPLLWLIDEYEPYLIALVDSEEAHFLTTYLGHIDREDAMASDRFSFDFREKTLMPRPAAPRESASQVTHGSNRDSFDDMIDEYIARFHRDVAGRITSLLKENPASRIVLGGSEKAAHAVYDLLDSQTAGALVDVLPIPLQQTDDSVMARVLPSALKYERKKEMELVDSVVGLAKSGGRGALGREQVEEAMEQQRVELLIIPWPLEQKDLVSRLCLRALQSGTEIELVHGAAADKIRAEGGLAARLYYTL